MNEICQHGEIVIPAFSRHWDNGQVTRPGVCAKCGAPVVLDPGGLFLPEGGRIILIKNTSLFLQKSAISMANAITAARKNNKPGQPGRS